MNPRAGDTVTSTKATNSTTNTTTNLTTTGERLVTLTRKRRQQQQQQQQQKQQQRQTRRGQAEDTTKALPEIKPPPVKSRRRTAKAEVTDSCERTPSKSRLGDFFSTLASRIRGPKHSSAMGDHENSKNRQVTSATLVQQAPMKRDGNELAEDHEVVEGNKRRKIEPNKCIDQCSVVNRTSTSNGAIPKNVRLVEQQQQQHSVATSECNDKNIEETKEVVLEKQPSVVVTKGVIVPSENIIPEDQSDSVDSPNNQKSSVLISKENYEELKEKVDEEENKRTDESVERSVSNVTVNLSCEEGIVDNKNKLEPSTSCGCRVERDRAESDAGSCSSRYSLRSMMKSVRRNDDATRLRKTIQWLEEGARRIREELTEARSQIYEERKAAKLARRELDAAVKEARNAEAAKYAGIVAELKARLAQSPSRSATDCPPSSSKSDILKDENHRREVAALKKRLAEAESTIQKLKTNSLDRGRVRKKTKEDESVKVGNAEVRKLAIEVQSLRAANKKLEDKFHIAEESARARAAELRAQHETHEAELAALQKTLRSDTIKMIDEIQSKNREIEKLEKLLSERTQINQKLRAKEDETMRKLRESERNQQLRLAPRIEEKIRHDEHVVDLCKAECEEDEEEVAATELDRLRELAIEQQGVIEVLRQAVKEKERKLEQLSNKRRKEEFYKQWLELEPVAEVDDEDEQQHQPEDGGDSALSSAPSSLSPQPNGHNNANGLTREAYESLLMEIEELQTKLMEEQQELSQARSQVHDLEKALLQETRGSQSCRRTLTDKLRIAEEREASLVAEISELREQNELLEFRVLELEESPNQRNTPDPADSGIVSPEPIHLYKEHPTSKHRDRMVATVIPYSSTYNQPVLASDAQKAPLSLQESGIFEDENEDDGEEVEDHVSTGDASSTSGTSSTCDARLAKLASQGTQTEAPAGELLQEVQRLQELRARIQERAAKVPPVSPLSERISEVEASCENCDAADDRICELEERLSQHESERKLSKQREEELLDENYRLAEKTYWLEAEIRVLHEKLDRMIMTSDAETMTDTVTSESCSVQTDAPVPVVEEKCTEASRLYEAAVRNLDEATAVMQGSCQSLASTQYTAPRELPCPDCSELWQNCDAKIRGLASTESRLRQQIISLEQREAAFFETLRQADSTWAKLEADYESKQREMTERLTAQLELNRALFEHLTNLNKSDSSTSQEHSSTPKSWNLDAGKVQSADHCDCASLSRSSSSLTSRSSTLARSDSCASRMSTISRTSIRMQPTTVGCDEVDTSETCGMPVEPPPEVATEAKEEEKEERTGALKIKAFEGQQPELQQPESHVFIDESSGEKKVSNGLVSTPKSMSSRLTTQPKAVGGFERNLRTIRKHRFIIYDEICV